MSTPSARTFLVTASKGTRGIQQYLRSSEAAGDATANVAGKVSNTLSERGGLAVDGVAVNAGSMADTICGNCKQRTVGSEVKKCGFADWCSVCDESLWSTNPEVICIRTEAPASQADSTAGTVPVSGAGAARGEIVTFASSATGKAGCFF